MPDSPCFHPENHRKEGNFGHLETRDIGNARHRNKATGVGGEHNSGGGAALEVSRLQFDVSPGNPLSGSLQGTFLRRGG